ncbi:MAG: electron transfer flavoprotein subunit beta [Gammaproteobacteria bacterium RIFCSPHIGHO2_12_FULL_41_20]|nr:MAG: electron transfer flavoprotein subunit beta [Gammaproteobacteria bacterium RIFCSPHIGHO2_12_FULL_41_20]
MKTLLIAEHNNQELKSVTLHALTAAKTFNSSIDIIVIGWQCDAVIQQATQLSGIQQVLAAQTEEYTHQLPENCAPLIADIVKEHNYSVVMATASTFSKNLLPRVAALLDVTLISDVTAILSPDTFVRPIYAGNALATVQDLDTIKILTIRNTAFPAALLVHQSPAAPIVNIDKNFSNDLSHFIKQELTQSTRPELTSAKIIISGGRGLKSAENFKLLESLADKLHAAVGASRAAVDAGFAPNDYQVGQTGKVVAPDLYIAIGISGAIQHLAGMKDSKVIVAINNDPEAPIFQIADYGLVGDLFKILPELETVLSK